MIEARFFYEKMTAAGAGFWTGVPDSLLKSLCAYIDDHAAPGEHITAVNEGSAIALAAGYHLATGKIPVVYMQNSGLGNATNPLLSLVDPKVYHIPLALVIGWRGEPGGKDESQHVKQGEATCGLLEEMDIPYALLDDETESAAAQIDAVFSRIRTESRCLAFVVSKGTFAPYTALQNNGQNTHPLSREEALLTIMETLPPREIIVCTTGMASREWYEARERRGAGHERDFLTVGSMGHASSIALGIALHKKTSHVTCLDGDGALLMHMGALATIGAAKCGNFTHILLNNGAHDSVGGQATVAPHIDIPRIASACGYTKVYSVETASELAAVARQRETGPVFIEVKLHKGARADLGRPQGTPEDNKKLFMQFLAEEI